MIRRILLSALFLLPAVLSSGKSRLVFMPQWSPQAQFAGYYAAKDKGFYDEEGLDVVIRHVSASSRHSVISYLKSGEADIITTQLVSAMVARDAGIELNNILQTSQGSALCCVSRKPLGSVKELDGLTIVRWKVGFSEIAILAQEEHLLNINWLPMLNVTNSFVFGAADATLVMSYNEYYLLAFKYGEIPEENVFRFSEHGYNFPEDAVFALDSYCRSHPSQVASFRRATERGWQYVADHPDEALEMVLKYMKEENVASPKALQKLMLEEVLKLQLDGSGRRSFTPVGEDDFNLMVSKMKYAGLINGDIPYNKFINR